MPEFSFYRFENIVEKTDNAALIPAFSSFPSIFSKADFLIWFWIQDSIVKY